MIFPETGSAAKEKAKSGEGPFVLCLLPVLAGVGFLVVGGPLDVSRPQSWIAVALASGGWLAALGLARRLTDSVSLRVVVGSGALALRLLFLAGNPDVSDDIHRYLWEGALQWEGEDPYRSAPNDARLAPYQDRWRETFEGVNHPEVPAAYPPLAQAANAVVLALAGGAERPGRARWALRVFYGGCDLLVCVPLVLLLRRRRLPSLLVVAWAWNPWVALEFAGSAHLDSLALLFALAGLACFPPLLRPSTGRASFGLALLSGGAAIKLLPVALVPFALRRGRRPVLGTLVVVATLVTSCVPFLLWTGHTPRLGGLSEYAFRWESFSLLYRWIEPVFALFADYDEGWADPRRMGRGLVGLAWLALGVGAWLRRYEPVRVATLLFGGFLVLTPTLHPWYLCWMVPFLALRPSLSWSALAAAAPLLYWPLERWRTEAVWEEPPWLHPALAGSFWVLFSLEFVLPALRARRGATP